MPLFGISEAKHFCSGYSGSPGVSAGSFRTLTESFAPGRVFSEGTRDFDELRDCSTREIERLVFLAISQYRRCFDLMIPSAASWALVTMYYGSFFAAKAILGMFGNWQLSATRIIDVVQSTPGAQRLSVRRISSSYRGPHQRFWELFYSGVATLLPWVDSSFHYALQPVSGDVAWLIGTRNDVNYDSFLSFASITTFQSAFRRSRFPASLTGSLSTHFSVMDGLVQLTVGFAKQFDLDTDSLNSLAGSGSRPAKVRTLILDQRLPDLRRHVRRRRLLG
jgi:hypothetical protein